METSLMVTLIVISLSGYIMLAIALTAKRSMRKLYQIRAKRIDDILMETRKHSIMQADAINTLFAKYNKKKSDKDFFVETMEPVLNHAEEQLERSMAELFE